MIVRANQRSHDRRRKREAWLTFGGTSGANPLASFGDLEILDEDRFQPGGSVARRSGRESEIITFVREGALAYEDSDGRSGVINAGEFHRLSAGRRLHHRETNASQASGAHVFQLWIRGSGVGVVTGREQRRFSSADRRGGLCVVASPEGRLGSLHIGQDVEIYTALLGSGQHVVHAITPGRGAWLHLVKGEVSLGDVVLTTGDSAGIVVDRALSLTAREESEILLVDLGGTLPGVSMESLV